MARAFGRRKYNVLACLNSYTSEASYEEYGNCVKERIVIGPAKHNTSFSKAIYNGWF